jgi:hypothetical protein
LNKVEFSIVFRNPFIQLTQPFPVNEGVASASDTFPNLKLFKFANSRN